MESSSDLPVSKSQLRPLDIKVQVTSIRSHYIISLAEAEGRGLALADTLALVEAEGTALAEAEGPGLALAYMSALARSEVPGLAKAEEPALT